jgi:septum formation protein
VPITATTPLVLGSASPRRRELVAALDIPFVVRSASADESVFAGEPAPDYVRRVTLAKLEAVRDVIEDESVAAAGILAADTIVIAPDGTPLGKPRDDEHARSILASLAATTHEVSTHFVLAGAGRASDPRPAHAQTVTTRVTFRPLSDAEIRDYVAGGEGRDKAGSYAIQGKAAAFVERIEGSVTNVVGLPLCEVLVALRRIGWLPAR